MPLNSSGKKVADLLALYRQKKFIKKPQYSSDLTPQIGLLRVIIFYDPICYLTLEQLG